MNMFLSLEKPWTSDSNPWKNAAVLCRSACLGLALLPFTAQAEVPAVSEPTVRICYLIPTNRVPQTNGVTILQNTFLFYREWYREQMELNGFGPISFNMETESDGWTPKVWVVDTTNTDSYLASNMWSRCWSAASQAGVPIWQSNNIWFVIGEAQIMQADGSILGHTAGGLGYADKGLAVLGGDSMAIMDPKYLTNNTAYNGSTISEIGSYPLVYGTSFGTSEGSTFASLASTYFGTCCHEFGHSFNLTHDFRNDWNFYGNNMANGCRGMGGYLCPTLYTNWYSRQTYEYALQLSLSRFFNPSRPITDMTKPVITKVPTGVVQIVDGKVKLDFTVTDPSGLGVALLFDAQGDFGSGVLMEQNLSGTSNDFTFLCPYYSTSGSSYTNGFRVQDIFGNETATNFSYTITGVTNRCPWSNIKILPPMPAVGQTVTFDASGSNDPDDASSNVTFELDFNGDGVYDSAPIPCPSRYYTNFSTRGLYMVKVRVTDPHGASFVSSPVGMRVGLVSHFVRTNSPLPMAPYNSWVTAATNLQDAINAAKDGDTVVVGPGVYGSGGAVTPGGTLTNRVCITNAITVRADAGPDQTTIVGASDGGGFGPAAIRCAFVGSNATLSGFTLSNGWTMASGDTRRDQCGGGALLMGGTVTNCTFLNNSANVYGGGASVYYGGSVLNSSLAGNYAGSRGGGVDFEYSGSVSSLVQWCDIHDNVANNYGGGVYCRGIGLVANSLIYSNTAGRYAGGVHLAYTSRVENCVIYANAVTDTATYGFGGGVMCEFNGSEVRSCTVADNDAGQSGGGIYFKDGTGTVVNSIFYFNTATSGANWMTNNATGSRVTYSCTTPTNGLPGGAACVAEDPEFLDEMGRVYGISSTSPARDAGLNSAWASNALDVAGNPRIMPPGIDMGAYESSTNPPVVTTAPITDIAVPTAVCGGEVTDAGDCPVTARGVCWGLSSDPTLADSHTTNGTGTGTFTSELTGLQPFTTYHVRAYATSAVGTSYGEDRSFNTAFNNVSAGLTNLSYASVAWGDYDSDGDLDAVTAGSSGTNKYTLIYRNDGGSFTNIEAGLTGIYQGNVAWGDYDNDGDLDLAIMGINGSGNTYSRIYQNDDGVFTNHIITLTSACAGVVIWGDYDNDGDLDLLLTGRVSGSSQTTTLYRNNGDGTFTAVTVSLPDVEYASAAWGDCDNDGDLDLILAGSYATRVYRNDNGAFTLLTTLTGVEMCGVAWGDYDNDGYLDLLVSGATGGDPEDVISRVYRNNGAGAFSDISTSQLMGCHYAGVAWGDWENDGDLDLIISGRDSGWSTFTALYETMSNTFTVLSAGLPKVEWGQTAWGDYDNDGDLDMLIAGSSVCRIYGNGCGVSNTVPTAPSALTSNPDTTNAVLSWDAATDAETPAAGLTYNLRIGTTPGGEDVMPAMADTTTGLRRVAALGNAGPGRTWRIAGLARATTYYWSVQAVDSAFAGGTWATEQSFTTLDTPYVTTAPASNITDTAAECGGTVTGEGGSAVTACGLVWNTAGAPTITNFDGITTNGSGLGSFSASLTSLTPGGQTYYVRAYAINDDGVAYGEQRIFATPMTAPGNVLEYDGTNEYVLVPDSSALDLTSSHTIELWFKADSVSGYHGFISKYQTSGASGWYLRQNGDELQFDGKSTVSLNVQVGRWYHVAGVKSGTNYTLYVNGTSVTLSGTGATWANSDPVRIGSDYSGRYMDGQLDEVRIWSVARNVDSIRDNMHKELVGTETSLVAYYNFNQISGSDLSDRTGHGHDGTLVNGPVWTGSTIPCTADITNRSNLRGVWITKPDSLASGRMSLSDDDIAGTDFAIFGHDGAAETQNTSDVPATVQWRLNRVWQMDQRGSLTADVSFDVSDWTNAFALLTDADGTFSDANMIAGTQAGSTFTASAVALADGWFYTLGAVTLPSVTTEPVSNITENAAACGGAATAEGSSAIIAKGLVWNTNSSPTISTYLGKTDHGSGLGSFSDALESLVPGQTYYVRAYAVNSYGVGYSEERGFMTTMLPPGDALALDGTNDYVLISDADDLDLTNNYTLECWFKADSFGTTRGLISKYQTASANGSMVRLSTNNLGFDELTTSNLDLQADHWYHVAAVNSNGTRSLYLNGIEQVLYGTPLAVKANSNPLRLGSDFSGRYLDGWMDEVRLWNAVRTEAEIRDAMHKELSGSESNLVAYYNFNSISGTTLYDRTGHGHDGALVNGPVWTNSTIPCAKAITNRTNLRAVWSSTTNSLASSRSSMDASIAASDENVLFGHDEGTSDWVQSDLPPGMKRRLGRVWQVEVVGTSSVAVVIDVSGMEVPDVSQLRLIANTNGVFADGVTMATGTLDGTVFTVADQTIISGQYYTLGEYYGVWHVDASRPDDSGDGMSWATAKRTIQAAVAVASSLDTIWVTNGVYRDGGVVPHGQDFTNRVVITNNITVQSVNGPADTFIVGASDSGTNGPLSARCVWISDGFLTGFTITNGHTQITGDWTYYQRGGGVFLNQGGTVSNCIISGCSANITGGGVDFHYGGLVVDCRIEGNTTTLNYGGAGASLHKGALLDHCTVMNNAAAGTGGDGGGLYFYSGGTARNCLVVSNTASSGDGGGVYMGWYSSNAVLESCTLAGNGAVNGGGVYVRNYTNTVRNCILYNNSASSSGANWVVYSDAADSAFRYTCTTPTTGLPDGEKCLADDPLFVGSGDYHLQAGSPCIDTGMNLTNIVDDLDGVPRPLDGNADSTTAVDMGCYEYISANADSDGDTMNDAWELGYDLNPTDPSDAAEDDDGDTVLNGAEHAADTDPLDGDSYFHVASITPGSLASVHFDSSTGRVYTMQGATNLIEGVWTNVPGAGPRAGVGAADSMQDTNEPPAGPFYRMEVQLP